MRVSRGFTLIELLVVIAIIGILSAIIVTTFRSARAKARDANRVSTLLQMAKAIELNADPLAPVAGCTTAYADVRSCTAVGAINFVNNKDPSYTGAITCKGAGYIAGPCQYSITRLSAPATGGATTQDYQICTNLETTYNNALPAGLINASSAQSGSLSQGCQ